MEISCEPRLVGAALRNLGNTCFLNAVLQCLTHTVPLVERILDYKHSGCCDGEKQGFCSLSTLKEHIKQCLDSSEYLVSPKDIADNLSKISPSLQPGQQEDAHEFLQSLLDTVHTCCCSQTTRECPSTKEEDSIVRQVFGGRLRSRLRCRSCGHCSDTYENLLDLNLEIGDADSIIAALTSFTKVEKIEDGVICDGCKCQTSMEKQFKLDLAPEVLILHLKRFENRGHFSDKISKHMEYTLELDLTQYLVSPCQELKYDLYAVIVHTGGSSNSGHYFSIVRSSVNAWHQMDDIQVTRVSENEALAQQAYILFYIKQGSSCWFSSLLESQKIRHLEMTSQTSPTSVLDNIESRLCSTLAEKEVCSTPSATLDRCESNKQYSSASSAGPTTDVSPSCVEWNHDNSTGKVIKDRFLTKPSLRVHDKVSGKPVSGHPLTQYMKHPISDHHVIDVFDDEPLVKVSPSKGISRKLRCLITKHSIGVPAFLVLIFMYGLFFCVRAAVGIGSPSDTSL